MGLTIGVPQETFPGERRVAMAPRAMDVLLKSRAEILIECGAGAAAGFPDREFEKHGAHILNSRTEVFRAADVVLQVRTLGANPDAGRADLPLFRPGQIVVGFSEPLTAPRECADLAAFGVTAFAVELIPRIARAQSMDALSSMASIAGYKAVLLAAEALPRMFPLMMTAAGTIAPARVFVLGAGVAGLQAIATAKRLGAVVSAYDVRPAVKEQIESVGGRYVTMDVEAGGAEDKGGYACAMGEEFYRRQREFLTGILREQDVVITTAAVPGKRAPVLVTREMVTVMPPGSVIVDVAAERGGNCELTRPGESVYESDVAILGPVNLPSTVPYHASQMYARNLAAFVRHMIKDGSVVLQLEDEIVRETLLTRGGEVVHPRVRELLGLSSPVGSAR